MGSFTVGDPRRTEKQFKSWCTKHFPKKMRNLSEKKWSATGISQDLRLKTLKFISKLDIRIRFIFLLKNNIPIEYRNENKLKDGLLYTNVVGELLEMYFPVTDPDFRVFCDKRKLSGMTTGNFKNALKARVLPDLPKNSIIQIETVDSTESANIQIADWIAGAFAYYLEKKPHGDDYYKILKGNIIGEERELFNTKVIGS